MDPVIIVGLGNPGFEYEETRHNVGFLIADVVVVKLKQKFKPGRGEYFIASGSFGGNEVVVVKPLTMMNNSGIAVVDVLERHAVSLQSLVVVLDDFAIPLGTLRLRQKGSDGGHNGLASLIYQLGSHDFGRIRCGIGREVMPPKREMAKFVLSPFDREEKPVVEEMVVRAANAVLEIVRSGFSRAMNLYNTSR